MQQLINCNKFSFCFGLVLRSNKTGQKVRIDMGEKSMGGMQVENKNKNRSQIDEEPRSRSRGLGLGLLYTKRRVDAN